MNKKRCLENKRRTIQAVSQKREQKLRRNN